MKKIFLTFLVLACVAASSCTQVENEQLPENDVNVQQQMGEEKQENNVVSDNQDGQAYVSLEQKIQERENLSRRAVEIMSKVPQYPAGYPTQEDALELYNRAKMAIGWIVSTGPVAVYDDITLSKNGLQYKRVRPDCYYGYHTLEHHKDELGETQQLIFDKQTLEAYLRTMISSQEASTYMEDIKDLRKFVQDDAGYLYVLPFFYVAQGYGEETYELVNNGDGTYTFNVTYGLLDDEGNEYTKRTEGFDLIQEDGRWVFRRFRVIKQN